MPHLDPELVIEEVSSIAVRAGKAILDVYEKKFRPVVIAIKVVTRGSGVFIRLDYDFGG